MDGQVRIDNFSTDRAPLFYLLAILLAVLATRPFVGVEHDGLLYAAQALNRLDGVDLSEDIFFKFGNQDQFSPFTRIFTPAIALFGLQGATALFWLVGLSLWVVSAISFSKSLFRRTDLALVGVFCALILNARYGSLQLSYGETFVSPRLFAEGFLLLGLAQVLRQKPARSVPFLLIAAVAHPLVGLTGWIIGVWLWLNDWKKFAVLSALGGGLGLVLGAAGLAPFTWMFERYDADWMAFLRDRNAIVLATEWDWFAGIIVLIPVITYTALAGRLLGADIRRNLRHIAVIVGLCLLASALLSDVFENRFFTGLQLWRALFLLHLVGNLCGGVACVLLAKNSLAQRLLFVSLALNMVETHLDVVPLAGAIAGVCALLAFKTEGRGAIGLGVKVALWVVTGLGALQFIAVQVTLLPAFEAAAFAEALFEIVVILALLAGLVFGHPRKSGAVIAAIAAAGVVLVLLIDDRSDWKTYAESRDPIPSAILTDLQGRNVYWEDGFTILWFKARMPSYYSCQQKSGVVFFRDQFVAFERRAAGLNILNAADFAGDRQHECPARRELDSDGPTSLGQLTQACAALPDLDVMVLRAAFEGASRHELIVPARFPPSRFGQRQNRQKDRPNQTPMYFYFCEDLR